MALELEDGGICPAKAHNHLSSTTPCGSRFSLSRNNIEDVTTDNHRDLNLQQMEEVHCGLRLHYSSRKDKRFLDETERLTVHAKSRTT